LIVGYLSDAGRDEESKNSDSEGSSYVMMDKEDAATSQDGWGFFYFELISFIKF
jgi:hypothetical protein